MAITPWGYLCFLNFKLGLIGLAVQFLGLIGMLIIGFSGKWNEI